MQNIGSEINQDPDLYNPLWINVTLCFSLIIIGNLSQYLKSSTNYHFNFSLVHRAFMLVFGLAIFVPSLICLCFFLFGITPSIKMFIGIAAIYSYSNIFFIIGSFFTLIPFKIVPLITITLSGILSLLFLVLNYSHFMKSVSSGRKKFLLILIVAFQILAILSFYFTFF